MSTDPYPEHTKQLAILDRSQAIGDFLDNSSYVLAEWRTFDDSEDPHLTPVGKPIQQILADYFEIDLTKIEKEKRAMLAALRGEE